MRERARAAASLPVREVLARAVARIRRYRAVAQEHLWLVVIVDRLPAVTTFVVGLGGDVGRLRQFITRFHFSTAPDRWLRDGTPILRKATPDQGVSQKKPCSGGTDDRTALVRIEGFLQLWEEAAQYTIPPGPQCYPTNVRIC